jgi:hypothetical protein
MDFDTKIADGFRNKKGIFDPKNVKERAKICRRWLREQKESVIVGESPQNKNSYVELMGKWSPTRIS